MIVEILDKVESTSDLLKEALKDGFHEEKIIIANEQIAGRGQFERTWLSKRNMGIYFSLLFFPKREEVEYLTKVFAISLYDGLRGIGANVDLKAPNDIYIGKNKLGGILVESLFCGEHLKGVVVGIGINTQGERSDFLREGISGTSLESEGIKLKSKVFFVLELVDRGKEYLKNFNREEIDKKFNSL